ncbi:MAG TPA: hypothetical protein VGK74_14750 [Symbiobacteriaceae bacterium]|jgi:hypothetical protein
MSGTNSPKTGALKQLTKEVIMDTYEMILKMSWRNLAYMNPMVMNKLAGTTHGVFNRVILYELDEEGAEAGIAVAGPNDQDSLLLRLHKSQKTGSLSLTLLVTKHSALRVPKGRRRVFPVSVRTEGDRTVLVLDLKQSVVEAAPVRKKKNDQPAEPAAPKSAEPAAPAAPTAVAPPAVAEKVDGEK